MKNEPVLTVITGLVVATVALLAAFGVDFTQAQTAAIAAWVAAVYAAAALIRQCVTPVKERASAALGSRKAGR